MRPRFASGLCVGIAIWLLGCSAVDDFEPRVVLAGNRAQMVLDEETLTNIVRASQFRTPGFLQITQVAGQQSADLKLGLPTFTIGPAKNAATKEYALSGNVLDNNIQGSFQTNPLVSSTFQQGLLSPVSPKILALLISAHEREIVLYSTIAAIQAKYNGTVFSFRNDPGDNTEPISSGLVKTCSDLERFQEPPFSRYYSEPDYVGTCNFSKFVRLFRSGLVTGLTAQLFPAADSSGSGGGGTGGSSKSGGGSSSSGTAGSNSSTPATSSSSSGATGKICFDAGLANPKYNVSVSQSECGSQNLTSGTGDTNSKFDFPNAQGVEIIIKWRSPLGVFSYAGELLRLANQQPYHNVQLIGSSPELMRLPFFQIIRGTGNSTPNRARCAVESTLDDTSYCIPREAYPTLTILSILEDLRNLSITPADLNASFSVRLTN